MCAYCLLISMFIMTKALNALDDYDDSEDNYLDELEDEIFGFSVYKPALMGLHHAFINSLIMNKEKEKGRKFVKSSKGGKEFLVFFDLKCAKKKKKKVQELQKAFEAKYPCYDLKERTDTNPDLDDDDEDDPEDDYIILDHDSKCTKDKDVKVHFEEYCISEIDENEEVKCASNKCVSKTVTLPDLWNLDNVSPNVKDGLQYVEYEKTFDPGFDVFVVDSGIDKTHTEFTGLTIDRIYDAYPSDSLHPHGTHVAGTIFSPTYGALQLKNIKSKLKVYDVRIMAANGGGTLSGIIDGLDEVIKILKNANKKKITRKAIINMSIEGGRTRQINKKIRKIKKYGGICVVAAGNKRPGGVLASKISPASSRAAITVGNLENTNKRQPTSNFGKSVDIWAPGTDILSTVSGGGKGKKTGTSMASPLVAAIAANILANNPKYGFHKIKRTMLKYAAKDADDLRDKKGSKKLPRVQIECDEYCSKGAKCIVEKKTKKTQAKKKDGNGVVGDYIDDDGYMKLLMTILFMVFWLCILAIMGCFCFVIGGCIGFKMHETFKHDNYKTTTYQPVSIDRV